MGLVEDLTEAELRTLDLAGYHRPQQARSVAATRRILDEAWRLLVDAPDRPLRLSAVLDRSATSTSTFYARFDSLTALVQVLGLVLVRREAAELDRREQEPRPGTDGTGTIAPFGDRLAWATGVVLAPLTDPRSLPRDILAQGAWNRTFVEDRTAAAQRQVRWLAAAVAGDRDAATVARVVTWLHLTSAYADQVATIGTIGLPDLDRDGIAERLTLLGRLLLAPDEAAAAAAAALPDERLQVDDRRPLTGHSDRHAVTIEEFRDATRTALVAEGLDLTAPDIAATAHRSVAAFFDTYGCLGNALADLAATEQTARIPTQVFRPRADVASDALVGHLVHRIESWLDLQGDLGRRILQSAGLHQELATVIVGQVVDSVELLTGWYAPALDLPTPLVRLLFTGLLLLAQHQVVWGRRPGAVGAADALAALVAPALRT